MESALARVVSAALESVGGFGGIGVVLTSAGTTCAVSDAAVTNKSAPAKQPRRTEVDLRRSEIFSALSRVRIR